MKRRGELSTREAARRLEVHHRTVRRWAASALYGEPSRLAPLDVRRDVVGRYWVSESSVSELAKKCTDDRGQAVHTVQAT